MSITSNADRTIERLRAMNARLAPEGKAVLTKLTRIALLVSAQAKLNIRRRQMIDSGRLLNSIGHEFYRDGDISGVMIGSFGVKYAALNEFGGKVSRAQIRAMFAAMKRRGGPPRASKGVVNVKTGRWKPRPYLRPALVKLKPRIIDILREELV